MSGDIQSQQAKESIEKTTLHPWVIAGIRQIAYEEFHSYGQREVDGYVVEWIYRFEQLQKDAK